MTPQIQPQTTRTRIEVIKIRAALSVVSTLGMSKRRPAPMTTVIKHNDVAASITLAKNPARQGKYRIWTATPTNNTTLSNKTLTASSLMIGVIATKKFRARSKAPYQCTLNRENRNLWL